MKFTRLMMAVALVAFLGGCGGTPQEDAAAPDTAQVAEPTPVFQDDFESGETEGWTEGEEAQADESEEEPTE